MKENNGEIKWNLKKKAEREQADNEAKAKKWIGEEFNKWKSQLLAKPHTREEIIESLHGLKVTMEKHIPDELKEFRSFTIDLIDHKLAEVRSYFMTEKNQIVEHMPSTHPFQQAQRTEFQTKEGLLEIPWVKAFMEKQGFTGIVTAAHNLYAVYGKDEFVLIGMMKNGVGVDSFPTMDVWSAAVREHDKEQGEIEKN